MVWAVPVRLYLLCDRLAFPIDIIRSRVMILLAALTVSSLVLAVPAGHWTDWTATRGNAYLIGPVVLRAATVIFGLAVHFLSASNLQWDLLGTH